MQTVPESVRVWLMLRQPLLLFVLTLLHAAVLLDPVVLVCSVPFVMMLLPVTMQVGKDHVEMSAITNYSTQRGFVCNVGVCVLMRRFCALRVGEPQHGTKILVAASPMCVGSVTPRDQAHTRLSSSSVPRNVRFVTVCVCSVTPRDQAHTVTIIAGKVRSAN